MTAIQTLLTEIKNLKPMPAIVSQLLELTERQDSHMAEIAELIQYDPILTANLIRTCNSAYFGLRHPVESIADAVALLGLEQVADLVILKSSEEMLAGSHTGYGLEDGAIWRASVSSAAVARSIATTLGVDHRNTLFTAGLLKDMGKPILDRFVGEQREAIQRAMATEAISFHQAEKKIIGVDHAELGGMLAKIWKFSPRMTHLIRHHHMRPQKKGSESDPGVAVVHLADCICMMLGIGVGNDGLSYYFHEDAALELGIGPKDFTAIMAESMDTIQRVEALLKVI